jgi:ABC-type nitrate/sulfonate/bicarbonate transport system ATPase subunit
VSPPPPGVELVDTSVRWGRGADAVVALDGLDLQAASGSFVALVGPSGCGKSTILRVLAGLTEPDEGEARIEGRSVAGEPGAAAWLPQRDALLPWRSVLDNATLGAEVAGVVRSEARVQALELLERFDLAEVAHAWPRELSGGMRQRIALLRTFLAPAPVLLLDEPFGALDALTRRDLQGWLQQVWLAERSEGRGRTVLLVTHDVEEALLLADRVVVLSSRPAQIVLDVAVDLPRPRAASVVGEPGFVAQRAALLAALGA